MFPTLILLNHILCRNYNVLINFGKSDDLSQFIGQISVHSMYAMCTYVCIYVHMYRYENACKLLHNNSTDIKS